MIQRIGDKDTLWFNRAVTLFVTALIMTLSGAGVVFAQTTASSWQAPDDAKKVENPVKVTPAGLKQAAQIYQENCVPCHGKAGAGDGPAAAALNPKPANFTDAKLMTPVTDGELFWKMSNGRGPMPNWKDQLSDNQRWMLVNYLRTLAAKTSAAK